VFLQFIPTGQTARLKKLPLGEKKAKKPDRVKKTRGGGLGSQKEVTTVR